MPIKSDRGKGGVTYVSPLGDSDSEFRRLTNSEKHYVHYHGHRISLCVIKRLRQTVRVTAGEIISDLEFSGTTGVFGRSLGRDSLRIATFAVLRWMEKRGEITQLPGRGWRLAAAVGDTSAVAADASVP